MLAEPHTIIRAIERTQREAIEPQSVWGLPYLETFDCTQREAVLGARKRLRILKKALQRQRRLSHVS